MTVDRVARIEHTLPSLFDELADERTPDYLEAAIERASSRTQRPAWTFPERWIPMELVTQRVPSTRMPWRQILVLAIVVALLAAAVAVYVGGHRPVLPQPFGLARNGLVAYTTAGDIYVVDPTTEVSKAIITGPGVASMATFSRDGTRLAFVRRSGSDSTVYVANADGGELRALSDARVGVHDVMFSPDGSLVLFTSGPDDQPDLWVANTIGQVEARRIDVPMAVFDPSFLPPDGGEIVFAGGAANPSTGIGLYAVRIDTGALRTILAPVAGTDRGWVRPSPDGTRIAYSATTGAPDRNTYRVHVVGADGAHDIALPLPAGATFEDAPEWSNDGKSLAVARGYGLHNEAMVLAIVPADASTSGRETVRGLTGCCDTTMAWSPDDTQILVGPEDVNGNLTPQLLLDPATASTHPAPWGAAGDPAWQRLALAR